MNYTYYQAFEARDDLKKYKDNGLLLFAVQMKFQIEDVDTLAADALTDGSNDKKCDLLYIDSDTEQAVLAQGYFCQKENKPCSAPANKACDLNTAVTWMLSRDIGDIPDDLRPAAISLRENIKNGGIKSFNIWYVHNLDESDNVLEELETVAVTAKNALATNYPDKEVSVQILEVGNKTLESWYCELQTNILVNEEFELTVIGGYSLTEADWSAFITAIPAKWLHSIYKTYGDKLFSANVRGYLGSRKSDYNILTIRLSQPPHMTQNIFGFITTG